MDELRQLRQLLPAAKLTARRRSVKVRPVLASTHHPRCPLSLWRSAAGPPASTLIGSQRRLIWAPLRPQPASVASSSHRLSGRTDSGDHTHHCPSRGQHGTASKVPYQILVVCTLPAGGRGYRVRMAKSPRANAATQPRPCGACHRHLDAGTAVRRCSAGGRGAACWGRGAGKLWCALRCNCAVMWECKPGACCLTADSIFSVNGDTAGPAGGAFDMDDTLDEGRHEGVSDTL